SSTAPPPLHSFPTRRSSDLESACRPLAPAGRSHVRALPGRSHHRNAHPLCRGLSNRPGTVLPRHEFLRSTPAVCDPAGVLRYVRPAGGGIAGVGGGKLRRKTTGARKLLPPLGLRFDDRGAIPQAHRGLLGL